MNPGHFPIKLDYLDFSRKDEDLFDIEYSISILKLLSRHNILERKKPTIIILYAWYALYLAKENGFPSPIWATNVLSEASSYPMVTGKTITINQASMKKSKKDINIIRACIDYMTTKVGDYHSPHEFEEEVDSDQVLESIAKRSDPEFSWECDQTKQDVLNALAKKYHLSTIDLRKHIAGVCKKLSAAQEESPGLNSLSHFPHPFTS